MSNITHSAYEATRAVEPGVEVIAFGDVHGRSDLLSSLFSLARDLPRAAPRRVSVLLGDLIDRGPDSVGCWRLAEDASALTASDEVIGLMGNHEQMMAMATALPDGGALTDNVIGHAQAVWAGNGGATVVGEMAARRGMPYEEVDDFLADARELFGTRAARLRSHHRSGDVLFVHAGVNPRVPLDGMLARPWVQLYPTMDETRHWAWVREPFLRHRPGRDGHHGLFVVHGHSPLGGVDMVADEYAVQRYSRINLDAGSFATGRARMARIAGDRIDLYQASADED